MRFEYCFFALVAASGTTASGYCGTTGPTVAQQRVARDLHAREVDTQSRGLSMINRTEIEVNAYTHVIAANTTEEGGYLTTDAIERQLAVLNKAYEPHKISFKMKEAIKLVAPEWSDNCKEYEMKKSLRKGTYADLNVYFFPVIGGWTGIETLDGVVIRADTVPGGGNSTRDLGMTSVHEVGHWFGLLHTFQGGCSSSFDPYVMEEGDGVDDTPFMGLWDPNSCDRTRDSCGEDGLDPVENYMDYSADSCYTHFTLGQEERMFSQWSEYREKHKRN